MRPRAVGDRAAAVWDQITPGTVALAGSQRVTRLMGGPIYVSLFALLKRSRSPEKGQNWCLDENDGHSAPLVTLLAFARPRRSVLTVRDREGVTRAAFAPAVAKAAARLAICP